MLLQTQHQTHLQQRGDNHNSSLLIFSIKIIHSQYR